MLSFPRQFHGNTRNPRASKLPTVSFGIRGQNEDAVTEIGIRGENDDVETENGGSFTHEKAMELFRTWVGSCAEELVAPRDIDGECEKIFIRDL